MRELQEGWMIRAGRATHAKGQDLDDVGSEAANDEFSSLGIGCPDTACCDLRPVARVKPGEQNGAWVHQGRA